LLVGGIGIMNIMLASISERVREIGIRKSVGAGTMDIFIQILVEAVVIAILGGLDKPLGVIGGGLVLGIAEAMAALYLDPTYTDIISFGLLVLVLVARPAQLLGRA